MRVCIIVPMYNEEAISKNSVETILYYAKKIFPFVTVVVVNDGSFDSTENIINNLKVQYEENELVLISHIKNQGYGAALKSGTAFAINDNYDYVIFMDSDLTNHPKYINDFYKKMLEGWDYIKATRYSKEGGVEGVPWTHRIISLIGNRIAKILYRLPLTDFTNGFRAVKVDILRKMNLKEPGFVIIMEELCQAKTLTKSFCEIPYVLTSRGKWHGKTHFSYGPGVFMKYFAYALKGFLQ